MKSGAAAPPVGVFDGRSISGLLNLYLRLLRDKPLYTKCCTAGCLNAAADVLAQVIMRTRSSHVAPQWCPRSFRMQFLLGLFMRGPILHFWFNGVERLFASWRRAHVRTVAAKVLFEQVIFAPLYISINLAVMGFLNGLEPSKVVESKLGGVWKKNVVLWSCVGMVQYRYVPPHLRVLVSNFVSIFWTAYLIAQASIVDNAQPQQHRGAPRVFPEERELESKLKE